MFSPLADAELGQQNIDVNFTSATDPTTANEINLLGDPSQIQNNLETWIVDPTFPEGVYSGAIFPETLMELEVSIKAGQNRGFETFQGNSFEIAPDKDVYQFTDVSWDKFTNPPYASCWKIHDSGNMVDGYLTLDPATGQYTITLSPDASDLDQGDIDNDGNKGELLINADPDCPDSGTYAPVETLSSNDWYNYDNSFDDPYGRDDPGISISWDINNPNWRPMQKTFNSDIQHWGEDSYHNFVAVGATAKFSQDQIMSGTSEFWVRSPLGGEYDADNSFLAIYEVSDVTETSFTVNPNTVSRNTTYSDKWWEATSGDTLDYAVSPVVSGGTQVYQSRLGAQDVILTDYSEMCYYLYDNGTHEDDAHKAWGREVTDPTDPNSYPWMAEGYPNGLATDPMNGKYDFVYGNGENQYIDEMPIDGSEAIKPTPYISPVPWDNQYYPQGFDGVNWGGCDRDIWHHNARTAGVSGLDNGFSSYIPDNVWPANHYAVRPADSYQTQTNPDPKNPGYERTYHRVNTFMYPNQAYLFIWYLELEAGCSDMTGPTIGSSNCPYFYFTEEDINTFKSDNHIGSYILTGEYNYENPDTNGDGIPDYLRKPANLDTDGDDFPLDAGMSFIFTQGQSNDMAGYTINADNTTMLMFKELDEAVKHEAGADGEFRTPDDELDYISMYMPFVNHDQKDITIEYIAWAFEEKPGGGFIYKPWFNDTNFGTGFSKHGYNGVYGEYSQFDQFTNDGSPGLLGLFCSDLTYLNQVDCEAAGETWGTGLPKPPCGYNTAKYAEQTYADPYGGDIGKPIWNSTGKDACYDSPEYNFYYSAYDYQGHGKSIPTGEPVAQSGVLPVPFEFARPNNVRASAMNDITQDGDAYRQQYRDYFLHSSSLIPEDGTTHILYMFKLGGHFHWEANLENNRVFGNWHLPMVDLDAISMYDKPYFISEKDQNKDGRTDGIQDNSTEITLLISKSKRAFSEVNLELPIWPVGGPGTGSGGCRSDSYSFDSIYSCNATVSPGMKYLSGSNREMNTLMPIYDLGKCQMPDVIGDFQQDASYMALDTLLGVKETCSTISSVPSTGMVYPRRIQIPTTGIIHYDEVWSRTEGYRVDAYESQELLSFGLGSSPPVGSTPFSWTRPPPGYFMSGSYWNQKVTLAADAEFCGYHPSYGAALLGGTSWHHDKMAYAGSIKGSDVSPGAPYLENTGCTGPQHIWTFPEVNARGASYLRPVNQATVNAEVFASVSITNGRWAQSVHTGGDSYSILDPVFHNRVVTKSSYTITIIAHSEDVYGDIAEIHGETPLEETTVLDQVSTFAYDLYQDIGNYWQAGITRTQGCLEQLTSCLWNMLLAIKEGIIEALEYAYDGTLAMYGTVMTKLGEFKEQIVGFGRIVSEVALSMVGVITTLVTEIGDSLDEIGQALLILITMLIAYGLYYMIVKHGTIIIMALEDV